MEWTQLGVLAVVVEALTERLKAGIPKRAEPYQDAIVFWMALLLGVGLGLLSGADLFPAVGLPLAVPYVGSALTGLLAGRGANVAHDLLERVKGGG